MSYNEKWGRDDSKREDVQNRYTNNFVKPQSEGVDPTLSKMLGDWSGRVGTTLEQQSGPQSKCEGCGRMIEHGVEYIVHQGGKKFHKQCYNVDVQCGRCNKPVFGEVVQALNKNWHPACFSCSRCSTKLTDRFIDRNGDPYCNKCGNEPSAVKTTVVPKAPSVDKNAAIQKRNNDEQEIFNNIQKGKVICVECAQIIGADENGGLGYAWNGVNYHTGCFKCAKCYQSLANKGVASRDDGALICENCATGKTYAEKCVSCLKPLDGKWITAGAHKYHSACFVCAKCRTPFDGGYLESEGKPYHPACIGPSVTKTAVPSSEPAPGQRTKGFTVDPRTGKKKFSSP